MARNNRRPKATKKKKKAYKKPKLVKHGVLSIVEGD